MGVHLHRSADARLAAQTLERGERLAEHRRRRPRRPEQIELIAAQRRGARRDPHARSGRGERVRLERVAC
jgi:hypothetical protein